jgi:hypothetical protein
VSTRVKPAGSLVVVIKLASVCRESKYVLPANGNETSIQQITGMRKLDRLVEVLHSCTAQLGNKSQAA